MTAVLLAGVGMGALAVFTISRLRGWVRWPGAWRWRGYHVEIDGSGRSGTVRYREQGPPLEFWWEFTGDGAAIRVPTPAQWDVVCAGTAAWATGRREPILRRVATAVRRQQAPRARVRIDEAWIMLTF